MSAIVIDTSTGLKGLSGTISFSYVCIYRSVVVFIDFSSTVTMFIMTVFWRQINLLLFSVYSQRTCKHTQLDHAGFYHNPDNWPTNYFQCFRIIFNMLCGGSLCMYLSFTIHDLFHRCLFRHGLRIEAMDFIALPFTDNFSHCRILHHD